MWTAMLCGTDLRRARLDGARLERTVVDGLRLDGSSGLESANVVSVVVNGTLLEGAAARDWLEAQAGNRAGEAR